MDDYPPFPGFRKEAFEFLTQLAANNERDWFKARKSIYDDEIVFPMRCLLAEASKEAMGRNLDLMGNPKKGMFRIYRDTRFSKNKDPYKTSCGAVVSRDGTTKSYGGIYIHLQPDNCFLASGFWSPETNFLRAWRAYMAEDPRHFLDITQALDDKGLSIQPHDSLKRIPRGYEDHAGTEIESYLKFKGFTTSREFKNADFQDRSLIDHVVRKMEDCYPLLQYGWDVEQRA